MTALIWLSQLFFRFAIQPMDTTVVEGDSCFLKAVPTQAAMVQWFKDGRPIPGATNQTLPILYMLDGDAGGYYAASSFHGKVIWSRRAKISFVPLVKVRVDGAQAYGRATFAKGCVVELSPGHSGKPIHYTLDGSEPDIRSQIYTGPFTINTKCLLRMYSGGLEADSIWFRPGNNNVDQN
jgi:hypothetical protein